MVADEKGITRYANEAFGRVLGYRPDELVGTSPAALAHRGRPSPADSGDRGRLARSRGHGNPRLPPASPERLVVLAADGGQNLFADPSVRGFLITMHDLTEQKQAAEALRESEERFRLLAENATDVIFLGRPDPDAGFLLSPARSASPGRRPRRRARPRVREPAHPSRRPGATRRAGSRRSRPTRTCALDLQGQSRTIWTPRRCSRRSSTTKRARSWPFRGSPAT